jgi:type III pantothenate kinase
MKPSHRPASGSGRARERRAHRRRASQRGPEAADLRHPVLLLDSGNSRLKWALCDSAAPSTAAFLASGAIELTALRRSPAPLHRLFRRLRELPTKAAPARIYACNVAGSAIGREIRAAAARSGLPPPQFARSTGAAGGVRSAYAEPWRLGVDRWVALIGARQQYRGRALCIVAVGSALTIDLLAADGRHRGGCILPGPRMMIRSLLSDTAGIRRRAGLSGRATLTRALAQAPGGYVPATLFARATRAALLAGARHACAALIERAVRLARQQLGQRPRLILAGGAADTVAPLLRLPYVRQDELVLRGLAVLAQPAIA